MIQIIAMAAMSVVRYVVTPSIRLDGAAARPIQRRRRSQVTSATGATSFLAGAAGAAPAGAPRRCLQPLPGARMLVAAGADPGAGAGSLAGGALSGSATRGGASQTAAAQARVRARNVM